MSQLAHQAGLRLAWAGQACTPRDGIARLHTGSTLLPLTYKATLINCFAVDWELLGMKWEGLYFIHMVLPFGLRSALFLFDELSSAVKWIIQTKLKIPKVIHILDDFFFATSPPRSKCMTALCQILHLFCRAKYPHSSREKLSCMHMP